MKIAKNGDLSEKFCKIQSDINPDYSIEVGANQAEFSVEMSQTLGIKATAFEANPVLFEKYRHVASDNLEYLNYAVWNEAGEVSFNIHHDVLSGDNSVKVRARAKTVKAYVVESITLDNYFEGIDFKKAALWIDVEGANREVLIGATKTLNRCASIFIETEDHAYWEDQWLTKDVIAFLEGLGFMLLDSEDVYSRQKNIIFVKKEMLQNDNKTS